MTSAEILTSEDRCARLAHWALRWQSPKLHPTEALRIAVESGLETGEDDPGQFAGDTLMTLAAERGLDTSQTDQYGHATHCAALADIVVFAMRGSGEPWDRPADVTVGEMPWRSGSFIDPSGTRLHRVCLVSTWNRERALAENHSWFSFAEVCMYGMPMTQHIVVIGQSRDGRQHVPWTKGYLHPVSHALRFRRKSGQGLSGPGWNQVWREQMEFSREKWLDAMRDDGVMSDVLFESEIPVPCAEVVKKVQNLAAKKMARIQEMTDAPEPRPSQCFRPHPCPFSVACWQFRRPSERDGFTPL